MGGLGAIVFIYVLGGITFIPLLIVLILIHAYFTFPVCKNEALTTETDQLLQPGDNEDTIKPGVKGLDEKFQPRGIQDTDVAAGYFAVCREYVPGGVNGKPPERTTPAGSTIVSSPSPSVYQSMYRSIFDRKQNVSPLDNKGGVKPQKKGGNIFYVVLRHAHLLLFDDETMIEVRYVLSLSHHDISIYGGGEDIPEGELFIKRNALCLTRKADAGDLSADGSISKPFFLFADNTSDKEDFYFAMLKSQERTPASLNSSPVPLQFDIKHMISLVQHLHSSEEHLQTRWINALMGRLFLGMYKTLDIENFIRAKITKKISRVKKPSFLSGIVLRDVDMGEGAPYITNPRLKDLTVDGDCVVEADMQYTGNFRLEIAAIARIDLGTRFKAREVNLLLAVVLKKIGGHVYIRIKPPPSNRIWVTFATAPKIDMSIEPIVSSRQITYTLILRQIESRIKEVIAESIVMPYWDDLSFFPTEGKKWRGGIWVDDPHSKTHQDLETGAAEDGDVDEVESLEASSSSMPTMESSVSMPVMENLTPTTTYTRKNARSLFNLSNPKAASSSSSIESKFVSSERPRAIRHGSFASAASPIVSTEFTNVDAIRPDVPAASAMAALSASPHVASQPQTPVGSPLQPSDFRAKSGSQSSVSSLDSKSYVENTTESVTPQPQSGNHDEDVSISVSEPSSSSLVSGVSFKTDSNISLLNTRRRQDSTASSVLSGDNTEQLPDSKPAMSYSSKPQTTPLTHSGDDVESPETQPKRTTLTAVANAAANARRWGLNALQRNVDQSRDVHFIKTEGRSPISQPMGRGRPLPPPGMPLPPPDRRTPTAPIPVPKRKPTLPPQLPQRPLRVDSKEDIAEGLDMSSEPNLTSKRGSAFFQASAPPPLPKRRSHVTNEHNDSNTADDGLFVVAAPAESEPTTPLNESKSTYLPPWVGDEIDEDIIVEPTSPQKPHEQDQGYDDNRVSM